MSRWIVQFRREDDEEGDDIELSVVEVDSHGAGSWGWDGSDKIILLKGSYYPDHIIERVKKLAHKLKDELNRDERG